MSTTTPGTGKPDAPAIEEAALAWMGEREDGLSPERARAFERWLAADPRHRAAIDRLERSLALLGRAANFRADFDAAFGRGGSGGAVVAFPAASRAPRTSGGARSRRRFLAWGAAAAALVLGVGVWGWRVLPSGSTETRHVASNPGRSERVRLADGSRLELHAGSAVRVRFSGGQRAVTLENGQAYFAVAPDPARPFVVTANDVSVRAVGTEFNVRAASDAVEVVVVEGRVRVARASTTATDAAESAPLVAAGERAVVAREDPAPQIARLEPSELREALAWQERLVEFVEEPLHEVVAQFNRRNRVQLALAEPALGERRIGGTFALDQVGVFVRLLEQEGQIAAERTEGGERIVLRRAAGK